MLSTFDQKMMATQRVITAQEAEPRFGLFNKLPAEVRYLIWEYALPDPRLIFMESGKTRKAMQNMRKNLEMRTWFPHVQEFTFSFQKDSNYLGDEKPGAPERSPLRLACKESQKVWKDHYEIPRISVTAEIAIERGCLTKCRKTWCFSRLTQSHEFYDNKHGNTVDIKVRGLVDMKRDTLVVGPMVFSLINGDWGFKLDIPQLRSIAYTSDIEYLQPASCLPFDNNLNYINPLGVVSTVGNTIAFEMAATKLLMNVTMPWQFPDKRELCASEKVWTAIVQSCPKISKIQYILLGQRNRKIWLGDASDDTMHNRHLLPLSSSVQDLILSPEHLPKQRRGPNKNSPIMGIEMYMKSKLASIPGLQNRFKDYVAMHQWDGNQQAWERLGRAGVFDVCALTDIIPHGKISELGAPDDFRRPKKVDIDLQLFGKGHFLHVEKGIYLHCDSTGTPFSHPPSSTVRKVRKASDGLSLLFAFFAFFAFLVVFVKYKCGGMEIFVVLAALFTRA
ncbi:hypothetical protein NHQ30_005170 [Ciborinia camelliae]|nr:hypothetical protein NHQ30_005170 [Ciborinia camelliae]